MNLLYSGASACDEQTLKRLLLVASRLSFMDRPSVLTGHNRGTIGHSSIIRQFDFSDSPVPIDVHAPNSYGSQEAFSRYLIADFKNDEIAGLFLQGLSDDLFAEKFLQFGANYGDGITGKLVRGALTRAAGLTPIPVEEAFDARQLFKIDTTYGLRATLQSLMADASIQVTSSLLVAEAIDAFPVANDHFFLRLLSQRTTNKAYVGGAPNNSWVVGMEFARAAIPDEALQRLTIRDVINYRKKTLDQYAAWSTEINQISAKIDELTSAEARETIPRLIAAELTPKLAAYHADMAATRDDLFAGLAKGLVSLKPPAVSLATFGTIGFSAAIAAFAASLAIPPAIDFVKERRKVKRKHAVSYLVGVSKDDLAEKNRRV